MMTRRQSPPPPRGRVPPVLPSPASTLLLGLLLVVAALPQPALAHDWQGAATPDCECLPHFKLDCADLKPVQAAWRTLVDRRCNDTLATAAAPAAAAAGEQKISLLKDAAAAPPAAHGSGHQAEQHDEDTLPPAPVFRCQADQACYEAFHVVIGHHYGCPPLFLPLEIAAGVHYYQTPAPPAPDSEGSSGAILPDTICSGCFQPRYVKKGAPLCPRLSCHGTEELLAGNLTLAGNLGCKEDCSSDACKRVYQYLSVHHDGCVLNDNPLPVRAGTDALRRACGPKHECAFSNGTYAAGTWKVDCAGNAKNAGPFKAALSPAAPAEEKGQEGAQIAVDHSAHDHGAASSAPSNVAPAAAASGAGGAAGTVAAAAALVAIAAAALLA